MKNLLLILVSLICFCCNNPETKKAEEKAKAHKADEKEKHSFGASKKDKDDIANMNIWGSKGHLKKVGARKIKPGQIDQTPPTVDITSPAPGATVTGTVTVIATASDNRGVSQVYFYIDNGNVGTDNSPPYTYSWNTTAQTDGQHTITARAYDAAGNYTPISVIVLVKNAVTPPPPPPPPPPPTTTFPFKFEIQVGAVTNQGSEGACVSFGGCYARGHYANNIPLSQEFLFNQTKSSSTCSGSSVITMLNFLKTNGVCTWASMPYSWSNGCALLPNAQQNTEALNYRIQNWAQILPLDTIAIKTALVNGNPLGIVVAVDNQFYNAGQGFVWRTHDGTVLGYHYIDVIGWDDGLQAFKIINSWGTSWGTDGYCYIGYEWMKKYVSGLMIMFP